MCGTRRISCDDRQRPGAYMKALPVLIILSLPAAGRESSHEHIHDRGNNGKSRASARLPHHATNIRFLLMLHDFHSGSEKSGRQRSFTG